MNLKSYLSNFFRKFGLKIIKYPRSSYDYLLKKERYKSINVGLLGMPFKISDSLSFYYSYREIFIDEIYSFISNNKKPTIIDCGSNYGTSIFYFKSIYPNSTIKGIEADPYIFQILQENISTSGFENVKLYNKAISNKIDTVNFFSEGADGGRVHSLSDSKKTSKIKTLLLDDLIEGEIDFLKMDIEGSETEVICNSKKLKNVNQLFIEYHSFSDSNQKLGDLLSTLTNNGFRYHIHTQFSSKQPFIKTELQLGMDLQLNIFAMRN